MNGLQSLTIRRLRNYQMEEYNAVVREYLAKSFAVVVSEEPRNFSESV